MTSPDVYTDLIQSLSLVVRRGKYIARRAICMVDPRLDPSSFPLLAFVSRCPGATLSDIADAQGVSKGTMSRQIARLEELRLLERSSDPLDSRSIRLHLTEAAQELVSQVRAEQTRVVQDVLADWDESDVAVLSGLLGRFAATLPTRGTNSSSPPA